MSPRREFSPSVRDEIIERSKNERGQICCEGCSLVLGAKRWDIDHTIPEAMVMDKSRPLTKDDGKLLGLACCHKPKTAQDVKAIAKAKRRSRKHNGDRRTPRQLIAGSKGTPWKRKVNGTTERRY